MGFYTFAEQMKALGSGAVTIREQARVAENPDNLLWGTLFPRVNTTSIKLSEMTVPQQRQVTGRRGWNAPGRQVTFKNPKLVNMEMTPIEGWIRLGEYEMQLLMEQHGNNEAAMKQALGFSLNSRISALNDANNRRIEMDAFDAWLNNQITVRNPTTGASHTVDLQIDSSRYVTESWTGTDAYDLFLAAIRAAIRKLPNVNGCMMRETTYAHIVKNGPSVPGSTAPMTRTQFLDNLRSELGQPFGIRIDERTAEEYQGADQTLTTVNYFTAQKVAFTTSSPIGSSYFAPVARAYNAMQSIPVEMRDANGFWTFISAPNDGKNLHVEAQVNALPMPNEQNVLVYSVGI